MLLTEKLAESSLYPPIKSFFEKQGYEVKGEVQGADVVATRGEELVIVELKLRFNLDLVLQGIERQQLTDDVYLAFAVPSGRTRNAWNERNKAVMRLCRRLGLGLLVVHVPNKRPPRVEPFLDPAPYRPRKDKVNRARLLREFQTRRGDPNRGGINKRPLVTAYRQDALLCADCLREGAVALKSIREQSGVSRAAGILQGNVYGWFERASRGHYQLTAGGHEALSTFGDELERSRFDDEPVVE